MPARTHTRPHTATTGGVEIRLPWWAIALPTLAFVVLLALILNPADTTADGGDAALSHLVARIQQTVTSYAS
ncbi:hypothetical protein [Streptomyces colonosanans]|uniref:Uncharacterized protein n=1 Tax=Streptomyces colonosanans TaxID=1428652 RepID=A0A1S2PKB7_9ACTN|nr:hypothetical protein [Streptomyces colonosanans]OIJ93414.1 hypothetical protein BIV24_11975 [Streptomyces colonosanans]